MTYYMLITRRITALLPFSQFLRSLSMLCVSYALIAVLEHRSTWSLVNSSAASPHHACGSTHAKRTSLSVNLELPPCFSPVAYRFPPLGGLSISKRRRTPQPFSPCLPARFVMTQKQRSTTCGALAMRLVLSVQGRSEVRPTCFPNHCLGQL